MNRITKCTLLVIMILMVLPSQSDACTPRLRTPQARARAMQLAQAITARAHSIHPVQRVRNILQQCRSR